MRARRICGRALNSSAPCEAADILEWHRKKAGTIELLHDVTKNELGAGVLPSGKFGAHAAWYRLTLFTHNVLVALKRLALPPDLRLAAAPRPRRLQRRPPRPLLWRAPASPPRARSMPPDRGGAGALQRLTYSRRRGIVGTMRRRLGALIAILFLGLSIAAPIAIAMATDGGNCTVACSDECPPYCPSCRCAHRPLPAVIVGSGLEDWAQPRALRRSLPTGRLPAGVAPRPYRPPRS
jgi:hypothetical protein